jgi:flagellar biosynthesis protein
MPTQDDLPENQPVTKAAALKYDKDKTSAPRLTAKGRGLVAQKILELAASNNIPLYRDADLIEILDKTELDTEIPLEVYAVVAEVFAYVYKVNQEKKAR